MTTVALIGAPGSGKSTIGALLAERWGVRFTDVDAVIEAEQGQLIREIFATQGEAAFRALEKEASLAALASGGVVSLGGGAPLTPEIAAALADVETVWLQVDAHHAARRIGLGETRPLLAGQGVRATLIRLLHERTPRYAAAARHHVDTSGREPEAIVAAITELVEVSS